MSERKPYPSDLCGRAASLRAGSSWRYLLTLYTVACLIEAMFLVGQHVEREREGAGNSPVYEGPGDAEG
jgi:hypothetical protein